MSRRNERGDLDAIVVRCKEAVAVVEVERKLQSFRAPSWSNAISVDVCLCAWPQLLAGLGDR